ncbi:MAG: DUF29 domain-containing protein [Cyanothece sp. SIO2G6]|nr:DUF29 domain-containing protein [Cyanothece sp. SIO2G6]
MVKADETETRSLYEEDILLWSEDTVAKLKAGDFQHIDLEHLIEEVEALGISQRKELLSRLTRLLEHLLKRIYVNLPLEHLLKRIYVNLPQDYNGWERIIRNQRREIDILLDQVPSLKTRWDSSFDNAWQRSLRQVQKQYPQVQFPLSWPFKRDIESLLEIDFWKSP